MKNRVLREERMMTMIRTLVTSRDPEGLRIISLFEEVLNKIGLDDEEAERLIKSSGEFQNSLRKALENHYIVKEFIDEEVDTKFTYPMEYKGSNLIEDQIRELAEIFNLDPSEALRFAKNLPKLPNKAEGWFAIPAVDALAKKHFPEVINPVEKYFIAFQLVCKKITESRSFQSYRQEQINSVNLRVYGRTAKAMNKIIQIQKSDILIIAGQLGMRHCGRSVRRARAVFATNEFGLTSVAIGSIIRTHPERFVRFEDLGIDFAGDEFSDGKNFVDQVPHIYLTAEGLKLSSSHIGIHHKGYGSASFFVPE